MSANINVRSHMTLSESASFAREFSNFPSNPRPNQTCVVNGILYFNSNIDGIQTWRPLTNKKSSYIHVQGVESQEWTITHNMNSQDYIYFAYDTVGNLMMANVTPVDENTFKLSFSNAVKGKAVVFFDAYMDIPFFQDLTAQVDTIVEQVQLMTTDPNAVIDYVVTWDEVLNKPNVQYQTPIPADQFSADEVSYLKAGKLATGGSAISNLIESDVVTVSQEDIDAGKTDFDFTGTDQFVYTSKYVLVFVNRKRLRKGEFTVDPAGGSSVTFNVPLEAGDELEVLSLSEE